MKKLLFLQTKSKKQEQDLNDEITDFAQKLMAEMKPLPGTLTKGFHVCSCKKASSDSSTHFVSISGTNYEVNKLLLHYVKNHRSEVPFEELKILKEGLSFEIF